MYDRFAMTQEPYGAGVIGGAGSVATAPLIRILCSLWVGVAAIHLVDTGLMCCILKQLNASNAKQEDKYQQQ